VARRRSGRFGGLWTNTCCGHPRPEEAVLTAAQRRLREEMGIGVVLEEAARFAYRATDAVSGLTEHEYDHVLVGRFDGSSDPDSQEVADWKWVGMEALRLDLGADPSSYSPWLPPALEALDQRSRSSGVTGHGGSTPQIRTEPVWPACAHRVPSRRRDPTTKRYRWIDGHGEGAATHLRVRLLVLQLQRSLDHCPLERPGAGRRMAAPRRRPSRTSRLDARRRAQRRVVDRPLLSPFAWAPCHRSRATSRARLARRDPPRPSLSV